MIRDKVKKWMKLRRKLDLVKEIAFEEKLVKELRIKLATAECRLDFLRRLQK
jgi:hypothetical protein